MSQDLEAASSENPLASATFFSWAYESETMALTSCKVPRSTIRQLITPIPSTIVTTHLAVLLPDGINVLESGIHVSSSTGDESGIVVSLAPQGLQGLVGLGGGLLELVGGRVEVRLGGGVGLDRLVDAL